MVALLVLVACASAPGESGDSAEADTSGRDTAELPVDADGDGSVEGDDCDDADAAVYPGAAEVCNEADDDCDGLVDGDDPDLTDGVRGYRDVDGDGYGAGTELSGCVAGVLVSSGDDCDDTDAGVNPAAPEVCDAADQDCDGLVDDACHPAPTGHWLPDDADAVLQADCDDWGAFVELVVMDVDGDGLDDVVTRYDCETDGVLALTGPAVADQAVDATAQTLLTGTSGNHLVPAWTDGNGGLLIDETWTLSWWSDIEPGGTMDDADLILDVEAPPWALGSYPHRTNFGIVPGDPGTIVVSVGMYDYDAPFTATWLAPADLTGRHGTTDLTELGWYDSTGLEEGFEVVPVDDLDGDGFAELVLSRGTVTDVYLGPISAELAPYAPDQVLGSDVWPNEAGRSIAVRTLSDDLDHDGRSDLVFVGWGTVDEGESWGYGWGAEAHRASSDAAGTFTYDETAFLSLDNGDNAPMDAELLDANADGEVDIAFGCIQLKSVYLEYGPFSGTRTVGAGLWLGGSAESDLIDIGERVEVGDTNGDGFDDLFLGGSWHDGTTRRFTTWVVLGGP